MHIKGGVPPYNISIGVINSPVITNVTIPSGFDAFTYINRAESNREMMSTFLLLSIVNMEPRANNFAVVAISDL